jgi:hypothetical protein
MTEENENTESRTNIINVIKTPLSFGALTLLIIESMLFLLMSGISNELYRLILIILMLIIFIVVVLVVLFVNKNTIPKTGEVMNTSGSFKYDVFIAAPMASINGLEFEEFNARIKEIQNLLKTECGFKNVFYAGENISTIEDFDEHTLALKEDIEALKNSKYFVLIYPEKIASSILFETGAAFVYGKPSFYFCNDNNLPFLLKNTQNIPNIRKYHIENIDDCIRVIRNNKQNLFTI